MNILMDPKAFNYLLILLYFLSAVRWAFVGSWMDVVYHLSAVGITAAVTFKG